MLFKATTRRTKGEILPTSPYQGFIHEAQPLSFVSGHDPSGWMVAIPTPHGAALAYGFTCGGFSSEAEALTFALKTMKADGWRETREEAETDMAAEIARRTNFRADGKPRKKK